jgi:hypothetical protein
MSWIGHDPGVYIYIYAIKSAKKLQNSKFGFN